MFDVKKICRSDIVEELKSIGFDSSYVENVSAKYEYLNLKIYSLTLPQANILKQTALSVGADCAVHRDILTAKVKTTDCILGGSISQLQNIVQKLSSQEFKMPILAEVISNLIQQKSESSPKIVGILNLTRDSFSDGGKYYNFNDAIQHLEEMILEGAEIIDIGAESAKPNSSPISPKGQLNLLIPVLDYVVKNNIKVPVSIDTRSSEVAKVCINHGASIINDVSGGEFDSKMLQTVANTSASIVLQHSQGTPENMQENPKYESVVDEIYLNLKHQKLEKALNAGISHERIILDVGIGFGKNHEHNFELINRIEEFKSLGCKLMIGISRKSLLGEDISLNSEKDIYSTVLNALAVERHVDFLRVHNVSMHKKMIDLMKKITR